MANIHLKVLIFLFLQAQVNDWKLEDKSGLSDAGAIANHREIQELD